MLALGTGLGLPFNRAAALGGWTPAKATGANLLQWLHDIDVAGSPWLKDKSQSGDDRILSGGPGLQQGRCVDFNGTTQYVDTGQDPVFGSAISVFGWIKTTATSGALASHYDGADRSWLINVHTSGHVRVLLSDDGTFPGASGKNYESTESVNDGNWHHIGFTFSDSTLKLYIDGAEISPTKSVDNSMSTLYNPPDNVLLGAMNAGAAQLLNGSLFGVTIFSDGLTANEVSWLYNHGAAGTDPSMTNCLGYYKLDEQSGTTAYDSSGNGNNGTYTNSPTHSTQDVYSWQNSVGYSLSGAVFVPRDESDTANDVTGSALDYSGSAPRHARLRDNWCVTLNGSNQYASPTGFTPTTTGELAIKFKAGALNGIMLGCNDASANRCYLGINASGKLAAGIGSDAWTTHVAATTLSTGQWYDAKVTWDGVNVKIYYKQLETGTETDWVLDYTGTENGSLPTSTVMMIGCNSNNGTPGNYFNGDVCDVRLNATHRFPLSSKGAGGGPNGIWNVITQGSGYAWLNSPTLGTQDVFAWNTTVGFHNASGTIHEALADGSTDTQGNTMSNPAVDGHNGAESEINFNPYTIPALASGNTDGYTVPTDWDVFEDDLKTPSQHWCLREDQDNDFSEFFLYDDELSGDDWDNAHDYVKTVSQLNTLIEHYWSMDALAGTGGQTTDDEINGLTLTGGSMDGETTVTPAQRGNAINIPDTGGSGDGTLSATAPANLNLNKAVSHFGWVKLRTAPSTAECMILDQSAGSSRVVINNSTNYAQWTYNSQVITDNVALNDSSFHLYVAARDADGNLTLWVDGRWVGKQTGVTMLTGTGSLTFGADGDMGLADVDFDEHGATDTNKMRDNHVGFLAAGKYLNKTTNEFEA